MFVDRNGAEGRRLTLRACTKGDYDAACEVPAIERGPGWVYAKPGRYEARFSWFSPRGGRAEPMRAIRILRVPVRRPSGEIEHLDSVLIHPANRPSELAGCIAPGLLEYTDGVLHSRQALDMVFACHPGGWIHDVRIDLSVTEGL